MESARRATVSAALFVLICFFLPWVQASCLGLKDSASGFDLARSGDGELWLIPLLMITVILLGVIRVWKKMPVLFALVGMAGGVISIYLMDRERLNAERTSGLVGTRLTGWFWLGFLLSLGVVVAAFISYLKRSKSP